MTLILEETPLDLGTLQSLLSCASATGNRHGIERELTDLLIIFRAIWQAMSEEGRILFHHSDASISYAFDYEADQVGRSHLESADAYYRLILENRAKREFDASGPEWIAGDMEQVISAAWDCLGVSEKGKALSSPKIAQSGDCDQPFRRIVITQSGDRDHALSPG